MVDKIHPLEKVFRTKREDIVRRIAAAYDWASDEMQMLSREDRGGCRGQDVWNKALNRKYCNLLGFTINGRQITYRQARVAYEMVERNRNTQQGYVEPMSEIGHEDEAPDFYRGEENVPEYDLPLRDKQLLDLMVRVWPEMKKTGRVPRECFA